MKVFAPDHGTLSTLVSQTILTRTDRVDFTDNDDDDNLPWW